ncbi:MAG TPA: FAD-linked oxidase C-terminal domain-containing protein, partial [Dehalococcoidia bacterium]|nr:FAD-linked oxidase C-terminal domain-containing protein [Dehalococcoidia bacterium]
VKNVAGYDLGKLMIGALGTLGVITEVTFKLWPAPQTSAAIVAGCRSLQQALDLARSEAIGRLFPVWTVLLGPGTYGSHSALRRTGWWFLAGFYGTGQAVARQIEDARTACERFADAPMVPLDGKGEAVELAKFRDYGYGSAAPATLIMRASSSRAEASVRALERAGEVLGAAPRLIALPEFGVATGFWRADGEAPVAGALDAGRQSLGDNRGSIVVQRAPAGVAVADAWGVAGPDVELMRRLKRVYDPHDVLNPGRFIGGI